MGTLRKILMLISGRVLLGKSAVAADGQLADRLAAIHAMVLDPQAKFSVRTVLGELDGIEPLTAPDSVERGRVMQLRSFVENKGERAEDSIQHGEQALSIEAAHPFLDGRERVSLHYDIARQAEAIGRCEVAILHYQTVLPLMAQNGVSKNGQLGTRQRLAFCLHQAKRFAEARKVNEALLADAKALFPPDNPRTFTARVNLAQNEYALGNVASAQVTLERLLADAKKARDADMTDQAMFQLGVLAFEGGRPTEALDFMEHRLSLARASGDAERTATATRDLDVLHSKLSGVGTP